MSKQYKINRSFTYEDERFYIHCDTEEEYYTRKANIIRDHEEGRVLITKDITVRQWVEQAIATYKPDVSAEYLEEMRLRIGKYILDPIGGLRIRDVRPIQCQQILNQCSSMSSSHLKKLQQEIFFIFDTAKQNHLILENPAEHLVRPSGYTNARRSITEEERAHVLKVCGADPAYNLFLLMLYCGCRPNEAVKVQGSDLIVRDQEYYIHIRGTKTKNADRIVPAPEPIVSILRDLSPDGLASPNRAGHQHTKSSYTRLVEHFRRDMNISMGCRVYRNALIPPYPLAEDFVPYCLRHTYCTDLARAGVDVRTAQYLMGHADIKTTANIYTHIDMGMIKDAGEKLSRVHVGCTQQCRK